MGAFHMLDVIFFFQAEDGIRDVAVTGVQTCALPISCRSRKCGRPGGVLTGSTTATTAAPDVFAIAGRCCRPAISPKPTMARSEERRVGKERRARGSLCQ